MARFAFGSLVRVRALPRRLLTRALTIRPEEASPAVRGFEIDDPEVERHLERVGNTFLHGYHAALKEPRAVALCHQLDRLEWGWRGFAYEGAGMALALLDWLLPGVRRRRSRLADFLDGPARPHRYLVIVGAGWTLARTPRRLGTLLQRFDPHLAWLAVDGYGFHHGFFDWPRAVVGRKRPHRLRGYALRAFDQGLGRSLWFVRGGAPRRIADTVGSFSPARRSDLWSGVGLACGFAGGVHRRTLAELRRLAGSWVGDLAQGAAFAAEARWSGGEVQAGTERAVAVLCDRGAEEVSALTRGALEEVAAERRVGGLTEVEPVYEVWRRRVRELLESGRLRSGPEAAA
ncbi:MAG: DUF1702 family protein [Acidobacteriota bacterium]